MIRGSYVTIQISFEGDAQERDLNSFTEWLRNDPGIRQNAQITLSQSTPKPGRMGLTFDAIQLTIDSGFQLASLALAIASWRRSNASPATMVVNGTVVFENSQS